MRITTYRAAYGAALLMAAAGSAQGADLYSSPIVVTATRTAETADQTLASVTVITRHDIESSGAQTVPELLQQVNGLDVTTNGPFGKVSSVFLRGTNSTQTLVLVDGVRVGSVTAGTVSWEFLPLSEIQRIEIVRGPHSSLYGPDAVGGVIQIFTRKGKGPLRPSADVTYGGHETYEAVGGVAGSVGQGWVSLHGGGLGTEGINVRKPGLEFGIPLNEPDKDGYHNDSFSAGAGYHWNNGTAVQVNALRAVGNTQYDSNFDNEDDFLQEVVSGQLSFRPRDFWNVQLKAGRSLDNRTSFRSDGTLPRTRFDSERITASWQNDFSIGQAQLLSVGLDYLDDLVSSTTTFNKTSRYDAGLFTQYQTHLGRNDLLAAVRLDHNEQFGNHTTGSVAWGYRLTQALRVTASYGTAFRAPTFNDLYFPAFFGFPTSNPNLRPETSRTVELGVRGRHAWGRWDISAYRTRIRDLISLDSNFIPQNVGRATIRGVEANINTRVRGWDLGLGLNFMHPHDDINGTVLARRSERSLKLAVGHAFGPARVHVDWIAVGRRFDDNANTVRLGGYGLVNATVQYALTPHWTLHGSVENLLDKGYETAAGFNTLGRTVFVGVRYTPGAGA